MKFAKLFGFAALLASTAVAGSFSQTSLPGRSVDQSEASALRGGGCVNALDNQCGTGARCSGTLQCVKVYNGAGNGDPTGLRCVGTTCVIFANVGTCSKGSM